MTNHDLSFAKGHNHDSVWSTTSLALRTALRSIPAIESADNALAAANAETARVRASLNAAPADDLVREVVTATLATGTVPPDTIEHATAAAVARNSANDLITFTTSVTNQLVNVRDAAFRENVDGVLGSLHRQVNDVVESARSIDPTTAPTSAREAIANGQVDLWRTIEALAADYNDVRVAQHRIDLLTRHRSLPQDYENARRWHDVIELAGGRTHTSAALTRSTIRDTDGTEHTPQLAGPPKPGDIAELLWLAHGPATAWVPTTTELDRVCNDLNDCRTMHAATRRRYGNRPTHR